jgi:hypothetical protein
MITVLIFALAVLLLAMIPLRRLPLAGQLWTMAAFLNTVIFFSMPTMAATSPWRPVVARMLATSAGASLALLVLGLILRRRQAAEVRAAWVGPLILGALPSVFYTFFLGHWAAVLSAGERSATGRCAPKPDVVQTRHKLECLWLSARARTIAPSTCSPRRSPTCL